MLSFLFHLALALALYPVKDFRVDDMKGSRLALSSKMVISNQVQSNILVSTTSSLPDSVPTIELDSDIQMVSSDTTKSIYYINAQIIGLENQTFPLLLDTGSSITWIFNESCTSNACQQDVVTKFDGFPVSSAGDFHLSYSGQDCSGSLINGATNNIDFVFDYSLSNFTFGLANTVPDLFNGFNVSGILGVPSSNNKDVDRNFIHQLNYEGLVDQQIFGLSLVSSTQTVKYIDAQDNLIALPDSYGGLFISGKKAIDLKDKFIDKELIFTSILDNDNDYWLINISDFSIFGDIETIIDTGTTGFVFPFDDAESFHKDVFGSNYVSDGNGNFAFPCSSDTNISFVIEDAEFYLNTNDFKGKEYTRAGLEGMCASMIQGLDTDNWVFGAAFLSKYYTVFDLEKTRIGFGDGRINTYEIKAASQTQASSDSTKNTGTTAESAAPTASSSSSSASSSSSSASKTKSNDTSSYDAANTVSTSMPLLLVLLMYII